MYWGFLMDIMFPLLYRLFTIALQLDIFSVFFFVQFDFIRKLLLIQLMKLKAD